MVNLLFLHYDVPTRTALNQELLNLGGTLILWHPMTRNT